MLYNSEMSTNSGCQKWHIMPDSYCQKEAICSIATTGKRYLLFYNWTKPIMS